MKRIKHVVYSHRDGLRWYFIDTERPHIGPSYFISLNPKDIKYLFINGLYLLLPPFRKTHIKGYWQ